jgi:hypothetical protein
MAHAIRNLYRASEDEQFSDVAGPTNILSNALRGLFGGGSDGRC